MVRLCTMDLTSGVTLLRGAKPMHAFLAHIGQPLAFSVLLLVTGNLVAAEIWVMTDSRHPVASARTADRLILLDAAQDIENELAARLPSDQQQAVALVQQRLSDDGNGLQQRLREAYRGVIDAWSLGVETVPAVIVDQRYVVYGITDLEQALILVERYREMQP